MSDIQVIRTGDGSASLLNTTLNETYHSVHGAVQESVYVFIDKGLNYVVNRNQLKSVKILEIGFGTGLNAWLTAKEAISRDLKINYHSLETFPLEEAIWSQLQYANELEDTVLFRQLHESSWNVLNTVSNYFLLKKINQPVQEFVFDEHYDIIYFDAFAPSKQPEMWALEILKKVCSQLNDGGVFVTYCAKGQLKRDLRALGLMVETLPGPPGKKEMVRGIKI